MFFRSPRPRSPRRGVTLVEMLVTVALLVLMMAVIVQIFQAATGAVSAARTYQDLDSSLRQLDSTIKQDLSNITARMTPPLRPEDNLGYFEYIENSFPDNQGEDSDDCLRFTVKAPEGQIFTGRFVPKTGNLSQSPAGSGLTTAQYQIVSQAVPITIQSQYAEVIYFLRNGNLYRRVLLVAPDRQQEVVQFSSNPTAGVAAVIGGNYVAGVFSPPAPALQTLVSWQGLNDLSAHPVPSVAATTVPPGSWATIVLNTLGALTNRENRYAAPRFFNDVATYNGTTWSAGSDGIPDDFNGDSIPDYWPSLYPGAIPAGLVAEVQPPSSTRFSFLTSPYSGMAFPYVYPYAYSQPDPTGLSGLGWIHSPDPTNGGLSIAQLYALNHSPLDIGDSLPAPSANQTWWGFPTWRETMSPNWLDPWLFPGSPQTGGGAGLQAIGLNPFPASQLATASNKQETLPPMTTQTFGTHVNPSTSYRTVAQLYNDGAGLNSAFASYPYGGATDFLWRQVWEDDLVMTGVRSFDIKAYDNAYPGYVDLGWGDDGRLITPYTNPPATWTPTLLGPKYGNANGPIFTWPPTGGINYSPPFLYSATLAHEGRMPPLTWDLRPDAQAPAYSPNIGDNAASTIRMRRTWDTWSTDYTTAPASGVNPANGQPYGLGVFNHPPVYPSYPPPYPAALRGLQIQIRAVDPRNERVKVLTIRQDFSDKL